MRSAKPLRDPIPMDGTSGPPVPVDGTGHYSKTSSATTYEAICDIVTQSRVVNDRDVFRMIPQVESFFRDMLTDEVTRVKHLADRPELIDRSRGIIIPAGGLCYTYSRLKPVPYFNMGFAVAHVLRSIGCTLPIEFWFLPGETKQIPNLESLAELVGADIRIADTDQMRCPYGWQLKIHAVRSTHFTDILFLDADNVPAVDPTFLFDSPEYHNHGAMFWSDLDNGTWTADWQNYVTPRVWDLVGKSGRERERRYETGQFVIDKPKCWRALEIVQHFADYSDYWGGFNGLMRHAGRTVWHGDPHDFHVGFAMMNQSAWHQSKVDWHSAGYFRHAAPDGSVIFQHCCRAKHGLLSGVVTDLENIRYVREAIDIIAE